ncbi:uncharacterized protein CLUP02_10863 [Colletotrichum lupini]|uniref:Uncharacterized protein n=1 Tax=Colletotrichum lupini TaxID=145971 RepID=A0A9Q8SXI7_9PEZI|nr:uncharacterized protein CLUP02_10863 [Colletotrichum lupini]UQC85366.1 hypothetical protein CLUP02_10863 [Colletotrichum lupini]
MQVGPFPDVPGLYRRYLCWGTLKSVRAFLALALESKPPPVPRRTVHCPVTPVALVHRHEGTPILVSSVQSYECRLQASPPLIPLSLWSDIQSAIISDISSPDSSSGPSRTNHLMNALSLTLIEDRLRRIPQCFARDPHNPLDTHVMLLNAPQMHLYIEYLPLSSHNVLAATRIISSRQSGRAFEEDLCHGCELQTAMPHNFMHKERSQRSQQTSRKPIDSCRFRVQWHMAASIQQLSTSNRLVCRQNTTPIRVACLILPSPADTYTTFKDLFDMLQTQKINGLRPQST